MENIKVRRLKNKDEFHIFANIQGENILIGYVLFWFEKDSGWIYRSQVHTHSKIYSQTSYTCESAVNSVVRMYEERVLNEF